VAQEPTKLLVHCYKAVAAASPLLHPPTFSNIAAYTLGDVARHSDPLNQPAHTNQNEQAAVRHQTFETPALQRPLRTPG